MQRVWIVEKKIRWKGRIIEWNLCLDGFLGCRACRWNKGTIKKCRKWNGNDIDEVNGGQQSWNIFSLVLFLRHQAIMAWARFTLPWIFVFLITRFLTNSMPAINGLDRPSFFLFFHRLALSITGTRNSSVLVPAESSETLPPHVTFNLCSL